MSNTAVVTRIAKKHLIAGAKAIATLDIVTRMSDDNEIEAKNIRNGYECHVAFQGALQSALENDADLQKMTDLQERNDREIQIIVQMLEYYRANQ